MSSNQPNLLTLGQPLILVVSRSGGRPRLEVSRLRLPHPSRLSKDEVNGPEHSRR
jgi:hypothetical protein